MTSILEIVPPPGNPIGVGSEEAWRKVEADLDLKFPESYKSFVDSYGAGRFNDFFGIVSPFVETARFSYKEFFNMWLNGVATSQRSAPGLAVKFPVHPAPSGIFPIGYTDNGGGIFLKTDVVSETTLIVCVNESLLHEYCEVFDLPLPEFLGGWLTGELEVVSLTPRGSFHSETPIFKSSC